MTTNFTRYQGETWRVVVSLEDSAGVPQILADESFAPLLYFSGVASLPGNDPVPIKFEYYAKKASESRVTGSGKSYRRLAGVYEVVLYISADDTSTMATGSWPYEVRMSEGVNPTGMDVTKTILKGSITIQGSTVDVSSGSSFTFETPDTPS